MAEFLEVGRIGSPFGIRGWVRVESWMDPPAALLGHRKWRLKAETGAQSIYEVAEARAQGRSFVVRLEGIDDRNRAASLRGTIIELARGDLPKLGQREFYRSDLLDLAVSNLEGRELGVVDHFVDAPANAVMVVKGRREHWIPLTPQYLRKVDLERRALLVDWPEELE